MCHDTNLLCYTSWDALKSQACNIFCFFFFFFGFSLTFSQRVLDVVFESIVPPLSPAGHNPYDYYGQRLISARRYLSRTSGGFMEINQDGGSTISRLRRSGTTAVSAGGALSRLIKRHGGIFSVALRRDIPPSSVTLGVKIHHVSRLARRCSRRCSRHFPSAETAASVLCRGFRRCDSKKTIATDVVLVVC